jgi:hypothetical protein
MILADCDEQSAAKYAALNPFPLRFNGFNAAYLAFLPLIDFEINQ